MNLFSFEFILFFLIVLIIYHGLKKYLLLQNQFLLFASYSFITISSYKATLIIISISLLAFIWGKFLNFAFQVRERIIFVQAKQPYYLKKYISIIFFFNLTPRLWLTIALIIISLPLFYFKYFEFIFFIFQDLILSLGFDPSYAIIISPLGISYITFNVISYLVSAYRNELPKHDLTTACLLFCYFPTITAGPLIRAKSFLKQFNTPRTITNPANFISLILLGVFFKWTLASNLSQYLVKPIFDNPYQYNSFEVIVATFGYSLQILFDFVAYIAIVQAIGLSLGFIHPVNFRNPYSSMDLHQFWRRWNISVSLWIRDYIYIPLGGSRKGFFLTQIFILIAMLFSALWHGANFNFIYWGLLHAIGIIFINCWYKLTNFKIQNYAPFIARLINFLFLSFTWIFFATPNLDNAYAIIYSIIHNYTVPLTTNSVLIFIVMLLAFIFINRLSKVYKYFTIYIHGSLIKQILSTIILLYIFINLAPSGIPNFIYANF